MNADMTSRAEWDAMTDDEKFQSLRLTEKDNADMRKVLKEIPECKAHGFCLPHFRSWIQVKREQPETWDETLKRLDKQIADVAQQ